MSNEQYIVEGYRVIAITKDAKESMEAQRKSDPKLEITPETVVREEEVASIQTENVAPVIPNEPEVEVKNAELTQSEVVEQPVVSPVVNEPVVEPAVALEQNTEMNIPAYEQSNVSENTVVNAEPVQSEMPTDGNVFDAPVMREQREQEVQMNDGAVVDNEQKQASSEYADASTFYNECEKMQKMCDEVQEMCEEIKKTMEYLRIAYAKIESEKTQLETDNEEFYRTIYGMTKGRSM